MKETYKEQMGMDLHQVTIILDRKIRKFKKPFGGEISTMIRAAVVLACSDSKKIEEDELSWINFRPAPPYTTPPIILYSQPMMNAPFFSIYGYGEIGKKIITKIRFLLKEKGSLRIGNEAYIIKDTRYAGIEDSLPIKLLGEQKYFTPTPIILYDKTKDHGEWLAISKNFRESDPEEYTRQMTRSITNIIRGNIKYQLKKRMKEGDYEFVDNIDINITRFHFVIGEYHKTQNRTPMLYMDFTSSWKLPSFIGHHVGKGYGQIKQDNRPPLKNGKKDKDAKPYKKPKIEIEIEEE